MRPKSVLAFAVSFVFAGAVLAQASADSKQPIFERSGDLTWVALAPQVDPGIRIADVWGDHSKTGFGAFLEFPAGFLSGLHMHTNDIRIVVISGTYTQAPEGKPAAEKSGPVTKPRPEAKAAQPDSPTDAIVDFLGSRQGKALQRKLTRGAFGLLRKKL